VGLLILFTSTKTTLNLRAQGFQKLADKELARIGRIIGHQDKHIGAVVVGCITVGTAIVNLVSGVLLDGAT